MEKQNEPSLKFSKEFVKKPIFVIPITVAGLFLVAALSLILWKPGIVRGEYNIQSIVDMLLNHEQRIKDIEAKTDNTQTQTNQNSEDIKKVQENTGTAPAPTVPAVTTPVTPSNPVVETPPTTPTTPTPTINPNNNSWTNSHGTFTWGVLRNTSTINLVNDTEFSFTYSFGPCGNNVRSIIIPKTISANRYGGGPTDETANYRFTFSGDQVRYFDSNHTELFKCAFSEWTMQLKNTLGDKNYPGTIGIWW